MKSYATDGPQAMARVLALTMIADGRINPSEIRVLHGAPFMEQVGVDTDTFDCTMQELCEDLLGAAPGPAGLVEIDLVVLDRILAEIQDPVLQLCLATTMRHIVHADGVLDRRETLILRRASHCWFGPCRPGSASVRPV